MQYTCLSSIHIKCIASISNVFRIFTLSPITIPMRPKLIKISCPIPTLRTHWYSFIWNLKKLKPLKPTKKSTLINSKIPCFKPTKSSIPQTSLFNPCKIATFLTTVCPKAKTHKFQIHKNCNARSHKTLNKHQNKFKLRNSSKRLQKNRHKNHRLN